MLSNVKKKSVRFFGGALIVCMMLMNFQTITEGIDQTYIENDGNTEIKIALEKTPENISKLLGDIDVSTVIEDEDIYTITGEDENGTRVARTFAYPVRYTTAEGDVELIDNSMVGNGILRSLREGYDYKNKANNFSAEFSKNPKKGFRMTANDKSIEMSLYNSPSEYKITASVEQTDAQSENDDAFIYHNAFGENTEVRYYNTYTGVKEDIILYENVGINRFEFVINTNGLIPSLSDDSSFIEIFDINSAEEPAYKISPLYVYDSFVPEILMDSYETRVPEEGEFRHYTEDCYYEIEDMGGYMYKITAVISEEFLNHPETVYPVIIDPSITSATRSSSNIEDTYIAECWPNTNYGSDTFMRIGNYNGSNYNNGLCFSMIRFKSLAPIPSNANILSASLKITLTSGQNTAQPAAVWHTTSGWSESGVTWNNRPTTYKLFGNVFPQGLGYYDFNVRESVHKWLNGYVNYGVTISYNDFYTKDLNRFHTSESVVNMPSLTVWYDYNSNVSNGIYYIRSAHSGKYLDLNGGIISQGQRISIFDVNGAPNQQWQITRDSSGLYSIRSMVNTNYVMDIAGASSSNGTLLKLAGDVGQANQRFWFGRNGDGTYAIMSANANKCLDVLGGYTHNNADVAQWDHNNGNSLNQNWHLVKANPLPDGIRYIKRQNCNLYLDVQGAWTGDYTKVLQCSLNYNPNQQWKFTYSNGYYTIKPMHVANKALNATANGVYIFNSTYQTNDNKWGIITNPDGTYSIISKLYGKVIDDPNNSMVDGKSLELHSYNDGGNQKFYFDTYAGKAMANKNFTSFSIGDDNMRAYNHFNSVMSSNGYSSFMNWDYTKGRIAKNDLLNYLVYSDVAFIDSHGVPSSIFMKDSDGTNYDYITLGQDISSGFKSGSTTKTDTIFNKKTKWLIIQACDQLNYGTYENSNNVKYTDYSATVWARALLGDGKRMHGILSYENQGPANDNAYLPMQRFLSMQYGCYPNDMVTDWETANSSPPYISSRNWAAICHRENINDKMLYNWTADTSPDYQYTIDRYSFQKGQHLAISPQRSSMKISISGNEFDFYNENRSSINANISLEEQPLTDGQTNRIKDVLLGDDTSAKSRVASKDLEISEAGSFEYSDTSVKFTSENNGMDINEDEAVEKAVDLLEEMELMPDDGYEIRVSSVVRQQMNLTGSPEVYPKETVSYKVRLYHTFNGVPIVSSDDEGIEINLCKNGISSMRYKWSDIKTSQKRSNIMSASDGLTAYVNYIETFDESQHKDENNVVYRQVYFMDEGVCKPAWVFGQDELFLNPTYIDAATGEKMEVY